MRINENTEESWPELAFKEWKDTLLTVQLWTQIVGKIRLRNMPWLKHFTARKWVNIFFPMMSADNLQILKKH